MALNRSRPALPRLASPLSVKLPAQATPALPARGGGAGVRLSPVEAKTLPPLTRLATAPAGLQRLPSLSRPAAPSLSNAEADADAHTVRELAARLALLLHARECCRGRAACARERGCLVRSCGVARGVLDHCQECFLPDGACHVSCAQAKRLLRHFRLCRARARAASCRLCATLRAEFPWALRHAASLSPLLLQPPPPSALYTGDAAPAVRLCRVVSDPSGRPAKRRR